jgi:hypothetical protein
MSFEAQVNEAHTPYTKDGMNLVWQLPLKIFLQIPTFDLKNPYIHM